MFYLEKPSLNRKDEIIEYLDEFIKYNSNINGTGGLDKIYEGYTFEEALNRCNNMEDEDYAKKCNKATGKTFLLIRSEDNKIVGTINVRWSYLEEHSKDDNIGEIIDDALTLIEKDNTSLKNVLPKDYNSPTMRNVNLGELIEQLIEFKKNI